jgi:NTP pyrophosphatase (non-canonical NTP hydrolase)
MEPRWKNNADKLHRMILKKKKRKWKPYSKEDLRFITLAMCGEAGELANFIKKDWRGDKIDWSEAQKEVADIRIYLELISDAMAFNLDAACESKLTEVESRYA